MDGAEKDKNHCQILHLKVNGSVPNIIFARCRILYMLYGTDELIVKQVFVYEQLSR